MISFNDRIVMTSRLKIGQHIGHQTMTEKNEKENSDSKVDAVAAVAVLLILLTTVVFWLSEF